MAFHVGQKVVCVDDADQATNGSRDVEVGTVYTIRWVGFDGHRWHQNPYRRSTVPAVRLLEVLRGQEAFDEGGEIDMPFRSSRFLPVVERKTDISSLAALLNFANHKVREGA